MLGVRRGASAQLSYLALGGVGVPVFAGFHGGLGHLLGPTGGYLVSYPGAVAASGLAFPATMSRAARWRVVAVATAAGLLGLAVIYAFGATWLAFQAQLSAGVTIAQGVLPFVTVNVTEVGLAALVAAGVARGLRETPFLHGL